MSFATRIFALGVRLLTIDTGFEFDEWARVESERRFQGRVFDTNEGSVDFVKKLYRVSYYIYPAAGCTYDVQIVPSYIARILYITDTKPA